MQWNGLKTEAQCSGMDSRQKPSAVPDSGSAPEPGMIVHLPFLATLRSTVFSNLILLEMAIKSDSVKLSVNYFVFANSVYAFIAIFGNFLTEHSSSCCPGSQHDPPSYLLNTPVHTTHYICPKSPVLNLMMGGSYICNNSLH